eukprot:303791-Alexandrium_andersonii.AAC.1
MTETQYIEWAQTPMAQVRMTAAQAKQQWDAWSADPDATGMLNTGSGASLQFRIPTGIKVDFESRCKWSKKMSLTGLTKKNATLEDAQDLAPKLLGDHNGVAGGSLRLEDVTGQILGSGSLGSSAPFRGRDLQMPDVAALGLQPD